RLRPAQAARPRHLHVRRGGRPRAPDELARREEAEAQLRRRPRRRRRSPAPGALRARVRAPVAAVVTHHRGSFRSGVARFNELLAERLGVPLYGVDDESEGWSRSLLSFKASEMAPAERDALAERIARLGWAGEVYLHEWSGLP